MLKQIGLHTLLLLFSVEFISQFSQFQFSVTFLLTGILGLPGYL